MSEAGDNLVEVVLGPVDAIEDPGCREFRIGEGDWPFKGFVVRRGDALYAYQNTCAHAGHPLNWRPDEFLTADKAQIICSSHGATFAIDSGDCTGGPCRGRSLRSVHVEVRDGMVVVRGPDGR